MFVQLDKSHFPKVDEKENLEKVKNDKDSRTATATCEVLLKEETYNNLITNKIKNRNVFEIAKTSAIMASKNTFLNLPLCFQNTISNCDVEFELDSDNNKVVIYVTCTSVGEVSVEMEALNACSNCALVIYEMCKSSDKSIVINNLSIISRTGNNKANEFRFLINEF